MIELIEEIENKLARVRGLLLLGSDRRSIVQIGVEVEEIQDSTRKLWAMNETRNQGLDLTDNEEKDLRP